MPLYDYVCDTCMMTTESLEAMDAEHIICPQCGKTAARVISYRAEPTWNADAPWIRSVIDVVDKTSDKPHVREFVKYPTRENYAKWMKGEGIRPLESGENRRKDRERQEAAFLRKAARNILKMRAERRRIEL